MNRAPVTSALALLAVGTIAIGLPAPIVAQDRFVSAPPAMSGGSSAHSGPSEQAIKRALEQDTIFEFAEMPLSDVANYISDRHKIPVQFDFTALKDAAIDPITLPITRNLKGIKLRSALNQILREHGLTWLIRDEVLLVTTQDKADSTLGTRFYDVRDLVILDNDPRAPADFTLLVKTIHDFVGPPTIWNDQKGQGVVSGFARNGICALIVYQTAEKQEEIEELLANLRSLKPADSK